MAIEMKHVAMLVAERAAKQSNCNKRQVAFVVFSDTEILMIGVNQHLPSKPCCCVAGIHDPDVQHAEKVIQGIRFEDGVQAVLTYAPCLNCAVDYLQDSNIPDVYVKHVKHETGLNHLIAKGINTHHEWLTPMQRTQAAWKMKWVLGLEEYL